MPHLFHSVPRGLMVCSNVLFASGAYLADWNETHIFNPRWPPHAKFHNGQSMSFGVLSSATAVYLLGRHYQNFETAKDSLFLAAIIGSLTVCAGLSAIMYPGTAWTDPEFDEGAALAPQVYVFTAHILVNWLAYLREKARLVKLEKRA